MIVVFLQHIQVVVENTTDDQDRKESHNQNKKSTHGRLSKSTHDQLSEIFRKIGNKNETKEVIRL